MRNKLLRKLVASESGTISLFPMVSESMSGIDWKRWGSSEGMSSVLIAFGGDSWSAGAAGTGAEP